MEERKIQIIGFLAGVLVLIQIGIAYLDSSITDIHAKKDEIYLKLITNYSALNRDLVELGNLRQEINQLILYNWSEQVVQANSIWHTLSDKLKEEWKDKTILEFRFAQERALLEHKRPIQKNIDGTESALNMELQKFSNEIRNKENLINSLSVLNLIIILSTVGLNLSVLRSISSRISAAASK